MNFKNSINGILWMILSVFFSRLSSLFAQLIAGWFLLPEDFGNFAAAFSIGAILMSIKNGGLLSFLLHQDENERKTYKFIANFINFLSAITLIYLAVLHDNTTKSLLLFIFAFNLAFSIYSLELRLHLSIRQEFRKLSFLEMNCSVIQYTSTILFLLTDVGVYSLAFPYIIVPIYEALYWKLKYKKGLISSLKVSLSYKKFLALIPKIKWPILSAFVMGLSLNGDYLALSISTTSYNLGVYFFAFQLTAAASQIITTALRSVIIPTLVALKNNETLFWSSFRQFSSLLYIFGFLVFSIGMSFVDFFISLFWDDKWIHSVFIIKVLLISLVLRLQVALVYSVFESLKLWRLKFMFLSLDAFALFIVAVIAGLSDDLTCIGIVVASYRVIFTIFLSIISYKFYNIQFEKNFIKTMFLISIWMVVIFITTNNESILFNFSLGINNLSTAIFNFLSIISITTIFLLIFYKEKIQYLIHFIAKYIAK